MYGRHPLLAAASGRSEVTTSSPAAAARGGFFGDGAWWATSSSPRSRHDCPLLPAMMGVARLSFCRFYFFSQSPPPPLLHLSAADPVKVFLSKLFALRRHLFSDNAALMRNPFNELLIVPGSQQLRIVLALRKLTLIRWPNGHIWPRRLGWVIGCWGPWGSDGLGWRVPRVNELPTCTRCDTIDKSDSCIEGRRNGG